MTALDGYTPVPVVAVLCPARHVHVAAVPIDTEPQCPTCGWPAEVPWCGECSRPFTSVADLEDAHQASDGPVHWDCCRSCPEDGR